MSKPVLILSLLLMANCLNCLTYAQVQLNEILVNPTGADSGNEFLECTGAPSAALSGLWFVVIEGDGTVAGTVDVALDLSAFSLGSNGLFVIRDSDTIPLIEPETTELTLNFEPDLENGTATFAIVDTFTGTIGDDLDTDNDGVLDSMPWTAVSDAMAWFDGGLDDRLYGVQMGGINADTMTFTPDTGFRDPATSNWYFADVDAEDANGQHPFDLLAFTDEVGADVSGLPWDFTTTSSGGGNPTAGGGGGPICASSGTLIEGTGQQNDFNATCGSDDVRWAAHGAVFAFQVSDPVSQFELVATAPAGFGSGGTISVDIEASKQNTNANLNLRAQMFNFRTNFYVSLPGVFPLGIQDAVQSFELPSGSDPSEFIDPNNNDVILLLQTIQTIGAPNVRTQLDEVRFNFE